MFSRSKKRSSPVRTVKKQATISIIKPGQGTKVEEPPLDLSMAKISIIKPKGGLMVQVDETEGEEDE